MGKNRSIVHSTSLTTEDFFRLVCEPQNTPIIVLNCETGEIIRSNHEAEKLFGYCQADLAVMKISEIIPSLAEPVSTIIEGFINGFEGCQTFLHRLTSGSQHTIEMHSSRLSLADAEILFCILHDITEYVQLKLANEHLENTREQHEIILAERTLQLNETMEHLRHETLKRHLIEADVTSIREKLENQERARVARDIHDGIGQSLQAIKLQLKMRQARCKEGEACGGYSLNEVIREITSVSTELREIIMALRPQFLEETNLDIAIRSLCERTSKRTSLNVRVECIGSYRGIASPLKLSIFRICQEALANIIKHAKSCTASVRIERDTRAMRMAIRDDGVGGVSCPTVIGQDGSGLTIMRERVELLGGSITIVSPPGMGTVITVEVPLP